jgi:hypothetical protein
METKQYIYPETTTDGKLIETGQRCQECGGEWLPMTKPGGGHYRGYRICPHCGFNPRKKGER